MNILLFDTKSQKSGQEMSNEFENRIIKKKTNYNTFNRVCKIIITKFAKSTKDTAMRLCDFVFFTKSQDCIFLLNFNLHLSSFNLSCKLIRCLA